MTRNISPMNPVGCHEAVRRSAGPHDPDDLVSGPLVVGGEHRAETVSAASKSSPPRRAGSRLRRAGTRRQALGDGPGPAVFQQGGHVVDADGVGARRAAARVALPLPHATSSTRQPACRSIVGELLAGENDSGGDHGEVAAGPRLLLSGADDAEVRPLGLVLVMCISLSVVGRQRWIRSSTRMRRTARRRVAISYWRWPGRSQAGRSKEPAIPAGRSACTAAGTEFVLPSGESAADDGPMTSYADYCPITPASRYWATGGRRWSFASSWSGPRASTRFTGASRG